jgi:hypothetical protein
VCSGILVPVQSRISEHCQVDPLSELLNAGVVLTSIIRGSAQFELRRKWRWANGPRTKYGPHTGDRDATSPTVAHLHGGARGVGGSTAPVWIRKSVSTPIEPRWRSATQANSKPARAPIVTERAEQTKTAVQLDLGFVRAARSCVV